MKWNNLRFIQTLLLIALAAGLMMSDALATPAKETKQIRAYIDRGSHYYRVKDFESAIKTWVKVLDMDPLNEEVLDLIDEAKFQAEYHVAVLDRLEQEKRLKTPYANELSRMADDMMKMLSSAEVMIDKKQKRSLSSVSPEAAEKAVFEQQVYIKKIFGEGMTLYSEKKYKQAFSKWDLIAGQLGEGDGLGKRIKELRIAFEAQQAQEGEVDAVKEAPVEAAAKPTPPVIPKEPLEVRVEMDQRQPAEELQYEAEVNQAINDVTQSKEPKRVVSQFTMNKNKGSLFPKIGSDATDTSQKDPVFISDYAETMYGHGLKAYIARDYTKAFSYWDQVVPLLPNNNALAKKILRFRRTSALLGRAIELPEQPVAQLAQPKALSANMQGSVEVMPLIPSPIATAEIMSPATVEVSKALSDELKKKASSTAQTLADSKKNSGAAIAIPVAPIATQEALKETSDVKLFAEDSKAQLPSSPMPAPAVIPQPKAMTQPFMALMPWIALILIGASALLGLRVFAGNATNKVFTPKMAPSLQTGASKLGEFNPKDLRKTLKQKNVAKKPNPERDLLS